MLKRVRSYHDVVKRLEAAIGNDSGLQLKRLGKVASKSYHYDLYLIRSQKSPRFFKWRICLCAGIHGDEPAGVEAILRLLEGPSRLKKLFYKLHFTILPCINPFGFEHDTRTNGRALDLNRQFR